MVKKYKRVLSIFLTLIMVLTCLPLNVFGAAEWGNLGGGSYTPPPGSGSIASSLVSNINSMNGYKVSIWYCPLSEEKSYRDANGDFVPVYDWSGTPVMNNSYYVNEITGEGHWCTEWNAISQKPSTNGTFDFQLSADKNWWWDNDMKEWTEVYIQDFSDAVLQQVLQVNGL